MCSADLTKFTEGCGDLGGGTPAVRDAYVPYLEGTVFYWGFGWGTERKRGWESQAGSGTGR